MGGCLGAPLRDLPAHHAPPESLQCREKIPQDPAPLVEVIQLIPGQSETGRVLSPRLAPSPGSGEAHTASNLTR
jgi:hypothetical protein